MTDMLEKCARAMAERKGTPWESRLPSVQTEYINDVLSLLRVLREPDEEMHDAARDWSYAKYGKPIGKDASEGCFTAMIDAILPKEEKGE